MTRDISAGDELLVTSKVPLNFRDIFCDNSDKETGEQLIVFGFLLFFMTKVSIFYDS